MYWQGMLEALAVYVVLTLVLAVPFIFSAQKTLRQVAPHNRRLQPKHLWWWLMPLPIVDDIIEFFLVLRLAQSLHAEYKERGIPAATAPTLVPGMVQWGLGLLSAISMGQSAGLIVLMFIMFFVYWMRIATVRRLLEDTPVAVSSEP